jgi:hypothetical protein
LSAALVTLAAVVVAIAARAAPPAAPAASSPKSSSAAIAPAVAPEVVLLPTVIEAERIPLPRLRGSIEVEVDPLRSTIAVIAPRDLGTIAARISGGLGRICPRWEVKDGKVVLRCRTRRLQASIGQLAGKPALDIQELRGMPRSGPDQALPIFYDPARAGLGAPCPGTTAATRGECALHDGKLQEAELQFKMAAETTDRPLAALRLGDLAAGRNDFNGAALWWYRAGSAGPFGRLAVARLCELKGSCLDKPADNIFEGGELHEPMRSELTLRAARLDAFAGRTERMLQRLAELLARPASGACVTVGQRFCRRLLLAALEQAATGPDGGRAALEVYLTLPARTSGPYDVALGRAAAERAAALGAPVFGGNLLASVAGSVTPEQAPDHLLRTVELYLAGRDRPRARLVLDYAETRLLARQLATPRWIAARRQLASGSDDEPAPPDHRERLAREMLTAEATRDLAEAVTALSRVRRQQPTR